MGLSEILFGPDGIGGQPGLVGKAGNAIWNGTGELSPNAGVGETLAKSLGNIPHMLTDIAIKNPLEILKNPASALNDRGEVSITRLLFPDFRREAVKQEQQQQKIKDAYASAAVMNTYDKILHQPALASVAKSLGLDVPQEALDMAGSQQVGADLQAEQAQQTAQRLGVPADVSQYVTPKNLPNLYIQQQHDIATEQQRQQENTRANAAADRAQVRFRERLTPEQRQAQKEADRQAQTAKEKATGDASSAEKGIVEKYRQPIKQAQLEEAGKPAAIQPENELLTSKTLIKAKQAEIKRARDAAYGAIENALPLTRRQNIGKRQEAKQIVDGAAAAAVENTKTPTIPANLRPQAVAEAASFVQRKRAAGVKDDVISGLLKAARVPDDIAAEALK